ncbi:hypothetical protein HPS36_02070 [Halorubrum salinarum]|uniref:Uncharacterized protein n=1 Tax=Halorubrum salinarum TaxID=2739057 RepID=A0A7D3XSU7_9EURY|nr:hypothetical protein [Halorubrum salinarum]QKG91689.1 hypothetical protein HPS36_02070 [Halorubrum salinarum]
MSQKQMERPDLDDRTASAVKQEGERVGIQQQQSEVAQRKFNPGFYAEIADPDTDTSVWDWIQAEVGPVLAKPQILGDRERSFVEKSELLDANKAERIIAESEPGRLLKKNPELHAFWQGVAGTDAEGYNAPIEHHDEKRVIRDALELATTRKSLSVNGRGLDALTKATTETNVRKDSEQEKKSMRERLTGVTR